MASTHLVIDVGTHSVRAAVFDHTAQMLRRHQIHLELLNLGAGRVEQNPNQILLAVQACVREVSSALSMKTQAALVVQRSTVLAWDRISGKALTPALSWQDTRGCKYIERLNSSARRYIQQVTGLMVSAHYGASKLQWLSEHDFGHADVGMGPLVSWLLFNLLSQPQWYCDESNAARTLLYDGDQRNWDKKLCDLFHMKQAQLPQVVPVIFHYGPLDKKTLTLDAPISLSAVCGDQNAAFIGAQCFFSHQLAARHHTSRRVLINMGTGAFALAPEVSPIKTDEKHGMLRTLTYSDDTQVFYATEGAVNGAASAIAYYLSMLNNRFSEGDFFSVLDKSEGQWELDTIFLNTVGGVASPWWCDKLGASDAGFYSCDSHQLKNNHIPDVLNEKECIAVAESIVFLLSSILERIVRRGDALIVTGGLSRSQFILKRLATLCRFPLFVPDHDEMTQLGGLMLSDNLCLPINIEKGVFVRPNRQKRDRIEYRYQKFLSLINKSVRASK